MEQTFNQRSSQTIERATNNNQSVQKPEFTLQGEEDSERSSEILRESIELDRTKNELINQRIMNETLKHDSRMVPFDQNTPQEESITESIPNINKQKYYQSPKGRLNPNLKVP